MALYKSLLPVTYQRLVMCLVFYLIIIPYGFSDTIATRISPPVGFERVNEDDSSFGHYLQTMSLKSNEAEVLFFNGKIKPNSAHAAVIDIDVGTRDLQQCADAVIRLRAEYLFEEKRFDEIHFNLTNGFNADYLSWKNGARLGIKGNKTWWKKGATQKDDSYDSFRRYLDLVFTYAGTISLANELIQVDASDIEIGDVFIQPGSPGHAVIVVDLARNDAQTAILLAQSYMPAQSIHIVKNPTNQSMSPWYQVGRTDKLVTPDWTFNWTDLKRFSSKHR
ncbi:DUF4846 domain-containing protein [Thorsellia anophelis]|uniref:DUF4846 domain-containing protein n=1 Tax=Thorsellia anophelis DSM 18579 TaxID=1123402 RepID=A0A1I0CTI2_9GAMM|nr:DUF4846 domain-containing protein [Thorsellia anophelis]SET22849.1 protein of unknown function (4846) [Thorsellia anophelis DSM 18579]